MLLFMFQKFIMRQLIKRQFKNVPDSEIDRIIGVIEKNPELFTKVGARVQELMKSGKDQAAATQAAMVEFKDELGGLLK
jgi:hypothetical protein